MTDEGHRTRNHVRRAAGSTPAASTTPVFSKDGPGQANAGQTSAQPGQAQGVSSALEGKDRTQDSLSAIHPGLKTSTTGAQRDGVAGHSYGLLSPALTLLIEAWDDLPEALRDGIVAMVRAANDKRGPSV